MGAIIFSGCILVGACIIALLFHFLVRRKDNLVAFSVLMVIVIFATVITGGVIASHVDPGWDSDDASCASCGTPAPANSTYCSECGHKLIPTCNTCGVQIKESDKFCSQCGAKAKE